MWDRDPTKYACGIVQVDAMIGVQKIVIARGPKGL